MNVKKSSVFVHIAAMSVRMCEKYATSERMEVYSGKYYMSAPRRRILRFGADVSIAKSSEGEEETKEEQGKRQFEENGEVEQRGRERGGEGEEDMKKERKRQK